MANLRANYEKLAVSDPLVLHGGSDVLVPPQSTAPLGNLPQCRPSSSIPALQHEILNEAEGPEIVQDIIDWLDAQL